MEELFRTLGEQIRCFAKTLVLQFMRATDVCQRGREGMSQTEIARSCGLLWGDYPTTLKAGNNPGLSLPFANLSKKSWLNLLEKVAHGAFSDSSDQRTGDGHVYYRHSASHLTLVRAMEGRNKGLPSSCRLRSARVCR